MGQALAGQAATIPDAQHAGQCLPFVAYILAKNERNNIDRCLAALQPLVRRVVVLDSGSTDGTQHVVARRAGVELESFDYSSHLAAYNRLTASHARDQRILVLDADMIVSRAALAEIDGVFSGDPAVDAVAVPLEMWWEGLPLAHGNLCPPKAIAFRGGARYFEGAGHGERLIDSAHRVQTRTPVVHDDRKPYAQVLENQWRYAREVARRARSGQLTWRDRLRVRSPLMLVVTPLYMLLFKGGVRAGRAGVLYALDRLIYEALAYRASISPSVRAELDAEASRAEAIE